MFKRPDIFYKTCMGKAAYFFLKHEDYNDNLNFIFNYLTLDELANFLKKYNCNINTLNIIKNRIKCEEQKKTFIIMEEIT